MIYHSVMQYETVPLGMKVSKYQEMLLADSMCLSGLALQGVFFVPIFVVVVDALPTRSTMLLDMLHVLMNCLLIHIL
jgi:hypothetical protein